MSVARATAMASESGTWLKRPLSTFCNDDAAARDAEDQRPRNKRARVDTFDDATQRLFEQLQKRVEDCIAHRARKDEQNRAESRRIAIEYPLTFPEFKATAATRPRSVSPYLVASSPTEDARTVCTKDTHLQPSCKNVCQGKCFSGCKAISSPGRSRAHPYQRPLRRDNPFFPLVPTLQPLHIEPKIPSLNLGDSKDGMIDRRPTPPNAVRFPKMELPMARGPAWADANGGVTPFAPETPAQLRTFQPGHPPRPIKIVRQVMRRIQDPDESRNTEVCTGCMLDFVCIC